MSDALRFWLKVDMSGDCWEWIAARDSSGYGHIFWHGGVSSSHRISWEMANGPIPKDMCVLHKCDNRRCVNPEHLFIGTRADNNRDRDNKGRTVILRGENHGYAKLSDRQVLEIRSRYSAGGVTQKALASLYGVVQSHISTLVLGKMRAGAKS
jgi:hypothetical protein